eukprot:COSAG01_NODE_12226_length_1777_cov_1.635876_3_plen_86_part_00
MLHALVSDALVSVYRIPLMLLYRAANNGGLILPQFGDTERDAAAVETLRAELPERTVVPVMTREILLGGGNIHCITCQIPRVPEQ